jgi:hypothetical protein
VSQFLLTKPINVYCIPIGPILTDGPFFGQNVDTRLEPAEIILFFCG